MIRRTLAVAFLLAGLLTMGAVAQQVPVVLHYQATLFENDRQVDRDLSVTARIFDVESGGTALWTEQRSAVPVVDGRLSLLLGSVEAFPATLFDDSVRFLELEVDGEPMPRLRMASTAYALRAGAAQTAQRAVVAEGVADGAVGPDALAPGTAVTTINDVSGPLTLQGENGATVNVDPATGTLIISAPGGEGGSGVLGVQNTDGTLQVVDPNGPTATINIQPGSIGAAQLADGGVRTNKLADGAVTARKIADETITGLKLAPGAAVTSLTAGDGLTGTGTVDAVTLGIADDGVTAAQLAQNAVTRRALAPGVAVDDLNGLRGGVNLTSSNQSLGVVAADGNIDLTLNPDAAVTGLAVGETTLTGSVTIAAGDGTDLAVADGTLTISAQGSGGTITGVTPGTGLAGGGTVGEVTLGVADGGIGTGQLADGAVSQAKVAPDAITSAMIVDGTIKGQDLAADAAVNSVNSLKGDLRFEAEGGATVNVDQNTGTILFSAPEADGVGIQGVQSTDGVLAITNPNGPTATINVQEGGINTPQLAAESVTAAKLAERAVRAPALDAIDFPSTGQMLTSAGNGQFEWVDPATGDVTGVTAAGGLAGGGTSGDLTLSIQDGGVTGAKLAAGAVGTTALANGAVETAKLAPGSVTDTRIADGAVGTTALAPGAVAAANLDAGGDPLDGQVLGYDGAGLAWLTTSQGDITSVTGSGGLSAGGDAGDVQLSILDGGITESKLATGAVSGRVLANGTVGRVDLADGAAVTSLGAGADVLTGDVLLQGGTDISISRIGTQNTYEIAFTGTFESDVTSVAGVDGIATVSGPTGEVQLGVADGGITGSRIADGTFVGGTNVVIGRDANDNVTVSAPNALTSAVESIDVGGTLLSGPLQFATDGSASIAVSGNTLTFGTDSGGLTSVTTDGTLIGDGTSDGALGLNDGAVSAAKLAANAVTTGSVLDEAITEPKLAVSNTPSGGEVLGYDGTAGTLIWTAPSTTVATDGTTLTGDGSGTPLQIAPGGVTGAQIADGTVVGGTNVVIGRDANDNVTVSAPNALTAAVESIDVGGTLLSGPLQFATDGSASIAVSGNTLTFGADSGGLTSVTTDGTLIGDGTSDGALGLNDGAVSAAKLATNAVTTGSVLDEAITEPKLAVSNTPSGGEVLGYDGTAGTLIWTAPSTTVATDGTTLIGNGSGTPLQVASGGIGTTQLADNAVDDTKLAPDAVTGAQIADGTVVGGTNVVIGRDANDNVTVSAPNALTSAVESIDIGGTLLSGPLQFATDGSASIAVSGNTLTFGADSGGLTSVTTDGTLIGDGTSDGALGLNDGAVSAAKLGPDAVTASALAANAVTTGSVLDEAITEPKLAVSNTPSGGEVLGYDGTAGALIWTAPSTTVTTDGATLTGDGSGTPLQVAPGGIGTTQLANGAVDDTKLAPDAVTGAQIADGTVVGGTNVVIGRDANDNVTVSAPNALTSAVESIDIGGTLLSGPLQFATDGSASIAVSGNTLTFGADSGGLTSVTTDGTLIGDGTSDGALGLNDGAVSAAKLAPDAVTAPAIATGAVGTDELADGSLAAVDIDASGATNGYALIYDDTAGASSLVWRDPDASTSSMRFKTAIEPIVDAQAIIERLRGVRFHWTDDGRPDVGLIAEEVARVLPELVTYEADGTTVRGLRYAPLVGVLIEAAKAQQATLDDASALIDAQHAELEALNDRVARLEALVESMHDASTASE